MKRRRRRKRNPTGWPLVTMLAIIGFGGLAIWGYKNMSDNDKKKLGV